MSERGFWLRNMVVLGSFLAEVGHLLLDDPRVDAVLPRWEAALGDMSDHRGVEARQSSGRGGSHEWSGLAKHPHRVDKAESPGIDVHRKGGLVHQVTDGVVGQQDAVGFLQDATRRAASKMDMSVELMRFQLVVSSGPNQWSRGGRND